MSYSAELRRLINEIKAYDQKIWKEFLRHSEEYRKALGLTHKDLEVLNRAQTLSYSASWEFKLKEKSFALVVVQVAGHRYGGGWTTGIMAVCLSDRNLNHPAGSNTNAINVVPENWHQEILRHLNKSDKPPNWLSDELKKFW